MPPDIAAKVAALGRVVDPPHTAPLYALLAEKPPYKDVKVTRDVAYGPDPMNKLDVFQPASGDAARPVLIFVHGGAIVAGDKDAKNKSPFYDNVMLWAVHHGMIGVNVDYRLAPKFQYPAAQEDVAAAVKWVHDNVAHNGGNPAEVFLMGHSAGGCHVATYVGHPEFYKVEGSGLAGAIFMSGCFDMTTFPGGKTTEAYYGTDKSKYAERSAIAGLIKTKLPLLVMHAELDPPPFVQQADELDKALCGIGKCPAFAVFPKHSHMSEAYSINSPDTQVGDAIAAFVKAHTD
jgi:triacylglycerol lipase